MRLINLEYFVASVFLAAQSPVLAQPGDADPAYGRQIATTLCSSCHRVIAMTPSDKADPPSLPMAKVALALNEKSQQRKQHQRCSLN